MHVLVSLCKHSLNIMLCVFLCTLFFTEFSKMQQTFAQHLASFKFQTIGEQSEDEKMISECHKTST